MFNHICIIILNENTGSYLNNNETILFIYIKYRKNTSDEIQILFLIS